MSKKPKIVVYTCIVNQYDLLLPPAPCSMIHDYVVFSDADLRSSGWSCCGLAKNLESAVLTNRYHKFFPHLIFPDVDYSIYVDGNIGLIGDISPLINQFVESGAALAIFPHRDRDNVAEEVVACLEKERFSGADLEKYQEQLEHMAADGMPESQRLGDNGIIFRCHSHPDLESAMQAWWEQLMLYTKRDQLSLPYILWKHDVPHFMWDWNFRTPNAYFKKYPHRGGVVRNVKTFMRHRISMARSYLTQDKEV